jgi:hypothetical protein
MSIHDTNKTGVDLRSEFPDLKFLALQGAKIPGLPYFVSPDYNHPGTYRVALRAPPGQPRKVLHRQMTRDEVLNFFEANAEGE